MAPSIQILCGASGSGKSYAALAQMRAASAPTLLIATDVVRAGLRATASRDAHPELWAESFNVPAHEGDDIREGVNVSGFLRQCAPIVATVNEQVKYAISEGWSCIVEGVHAVPGLLTLPNDVPTSWSMYVIANSTLHEQLFTLRDAATDGRRNADHYISNLPRIAVIRDVLREHWDAATNAGAISGEIVEITALP